MHFGPNQGELHVYCFKFDKKEKKIAKDRVHIAKIKLSKHLTIISD